MAPHLDDLSIGPHAGVATPGNGIVCGHRACAKPIERPRRGQRFCSSTCRFREWETRHPRLAPPKPRGEVTIRDEVLGLLADGLWRTDREIALALGCLEATAGAKRRDLRKAAFGQFRVENRRRPGAHEHEYRLLLGER